MADEKLVWLNTLTGEFSESWREEEFLFKTETLYDEHTKKEGWKLLKYKCLNDKDFKFTANFKLR